MRKLALLSQALLLLLLGACTGAVSRGSDDGCGPEGLRLRVSARPAAACTTSVAFR